MTLAKKSYSFDVILKESSLESPEREENRYIYAVCVLKEYIQLTPNRLFVDYFPPQPLNKFFSNPCDLIGSLSSKGIHVIVYEHNAEVCSGNGMPSSRLLRAVADPSFSVEEVISVDMVQNNKMIGNLVLKLQLSCVNRGVDTRMQPGCNNVCQPVEKEISPNDMIFILGRSDKCALRSCMADEQLGSPAEAALDSNEDGPMGESSKCKIGGPEDENEIQDELLKKLLSELDFENMKINVATRKLKRRKCAIPCEKETKPSMPEFEGEFTPQQLAELRNARKRDLGACPRLSPLELRVPKYVPPTLCRVCQANITWLPKLAACPYCGYRRVELDRPSEEPFDETATAADVLRNHVLHTQGGQEDRQSDHNLTADYDSPPAANSYQVQPLYKKKNSKDAKSPEEKAAVARQKELSPEEYRKQLEKIFTEMRDAYRQKTLDEEQVEKALMYCEEIAGKGTKVRLNKRSAVTKKLLDEIEHAYPTQKMKKKKKARVVKPKSTRRRKPNRYMYIVRLDPSRPRQSHKTCAQKADRVPSHMGWMWNKCLSGPNNRCWKPGKIRKPIRVLMEYFLKDYPLDSIAYSRSQRKPPPAEEEEPLVQYPTLHIQKKHDEYTITLRPLKDPKSLAVAANPYANMRPVVFRISKDPYATGIRKMKQELIRKGYPLCTCQQPVANCYCRTHVDQKILAHEVSKLSRAQGWKDISERFVYSDLSGSDSDSELEFGVTPPAGVVKPERLIKHHLISSETQYNESDWTTTSMFPIKPTPMLQYSSCVMGERKGRFPWIPGKGWGSLEPKPKRKKCDDGKSKPKPRKRHMCFSDKRDWHKSNDPPMPMCSHGLSGLNCLNGMGTTNGNWKF